MLARVHAEVRRQGTRALSEALSDLHGSLIANVCECQFGVPLRGNIDGSRELFLLGLERDRDGELRLADRQSAFPLANEWGSWLGGERPLKGERAKSLGLGDAAGDLAVVEPAIESRVRLCELKVDSVSAELLETGLEFGLGEEPLYLLAEASVRGCCVTRDSASTNSLPAVRAASRAAAWAGPTSL